MNDKKTILFTAVSSIIFFAPFLASAATLSLAPASGGYNVGDIISVNIMLDTQSDFARGADIRYLKTPVVPAFRLLRGH